MDQAPTLPNISDDDFNALRSIMYEQTGVNLSDSKRMLIAARLRKRLEELSLSDFHAYRQYLKSHSQSEMSVFINAITTNETYCFRHSNQFNFLHDVILKQCVTQKKTVKPNEVRIWSGASSTGEEPYSLMITCEEFFKSHTSWKYTLKASDVNTDVLDQARRAVFNERSVSKVPPALLDKYFEKKAAEKAFQNFTFEVKSKYKSKITFFQHNLLNVLQGEVFDVIFLRNVIIYFDSEIKKKVTLNVLKSLKPGGYLIISLSENLMDCSSDIKSLGKGIYQKVM